MESPLAELEAWWNVAYDDGGASTRLTSFLKSGEGYRLKFETIDDADAEAAWRLDVEDVVEMVWRDEWAEPRWFAEHVLLWPYVDGVSGISIAKPLNDPLRARGAIDRAHSRTVGDWYPSGRFVKGSYDAPFGQLAVGPERLIQVYSEALLALGEEIHVASYNRLFSREEKTASLHALTWGGSYFVARSFRLERLA